LVPSTLIGTAGENVLFAHEYFGLGMTERKPGMTSLLGNPVEGIRHRGLYKVAYRWVDRWGNLSPISPHLPIPLSELDSGETAFPIPLNIERALAAAGLGGLAPGPGATVGRTVVRSRDLLSSGDTEMYEIPGGYPSTWATIPENESDRFSISGTDLHMGALAQDTIPVPEFRLVRMAMGRCWIGNAKDDQGFLAPSLPGQWGTFLRDEVMYPDSTGSELTGLWPFAGGLLACTRSSTYLIMENDKGGGFRADPVSRQIGCAGPSTMATLPDGRPIWFTGDDFVVMTEKGLESTGAKATLGRTLARLNTARAAQGTAVVDPRTGEYRCWLASGGSTQNDVAFVYHEGQWRERPGEKYGATCALRDGSGLVLGAGRADIGAGYDFGVWVMDRQTPAAIGAPRTYTFETCWLTRSPEGDYSSPQQVHFWLREERANDVTLAVYRDWREGEDLTDGTAVVSNHATHDLPSTWGVTELGDDVRWQRRRFFWTRKSIGAPSCDCFKVVLTSTSPFSIMGLELEGIRRAAHARMGGM
jgi:hypothetical protein